jgi:hypothetical protein
VYHGSPEIFLHPAIPYFLPNQKSGKWRKMLRDFGKPEIRLFPACEQSFLSQLNQLSF